MDQRAERRVESRCRRFFCRRRLQLMQLVHSSDVRSQLEQLIRIPHRFFVELAWPADHSCVDISGLSLCGGRRGILNLLRKVISRCLENRCHRPLLLKSHVQLLDGCRHLFLWSRHGYFGFTVGTRCYPPCSTAWIPTLDPSLTAATVRLLHFVLIGLTPAFPGALRSTLSLGLSAPLDNKPRFQCSVKQSRLRSPVKQQSRLRYHVVGAYM